jgi:hypothetical protein
MLRLSSTTGTNGRSRCCTWHDLDLQLARRIQ